MTYMIDPDKDLLIFREREIAKERLAEKKHEEAQKSFKNKAVPQGQEANKAKQAVNATEGNSTGLSAEQEEWKKAEEGISTNASANEKSIEEEKRKREEELKAENDAIEKEKRELESKAKELEEERLKLEQEKEEMEKALKEAKEAEEKKVIEEEKRKKEEELKAENDAIENKKRELEEQRSRLEEKKQEVNGRQKQQGNLQVQNSKGSAVNEALLSEGYTKEPDWNYSRIEEGIYSQVNEALEMDGNISTSGKKKVTTKSEEESRRLAEGLTCVWHPWRKAYAVCAICHRPFCFEDLVEYGGKYYCLEDIDKVKIENAPESRSQYFNAIAGVMFILPFLLLFYLNLDSIMNAVGLAQSLGFFSFVNAKYLPYLMQIAYIVLAFVGFAEGVLAFIGSRKALPIGIGIGSAIIVALAYAYITTLSADYLLIIFIYIAAIAFVVYARFLYDIELTVTQRINESEMPADWPTATARF